MSPGTVSGGADRGSGRLDSELVRRGLARSRARAAELIAEGRIAVDSVVLSKPAARVGADQEIVLAGDDRPDYVSRAGHKLAGALADFAAAGRAPRELIRGRRCLDAGASTGGFTQVLLDAGAASVAAVDVGHGQLVPELAAHERVRSLEGTNIRHLAPGDIGGPVDVVVADLSFISLTLVLPVLRSVVVGDADLFLLVKPQFELQRSDLNSHGVVTDPAKHARALRSVAVAADAAGFRAEAVSRSRLPGPSGNIEYFLWLRPEDPPGAGSAVPSGTGPVVDNMLAVHEFARHLEDRTASS